MENTITTNNLTVGYGQRKVVNNICIEGLRGQIICLLGPNGVGKSTILRTLSGLLAPVEGIVKIADADISSIKSAEIAKKLSVVLTDSVSPRLVTVREIIAMGRTPYTNFFGKMTDNDRKVINEAIENVGVAYLADRYFGELSDGEKQKVMIARALAQEPELIILDEPTSHLDIRHKVEVVRILRDLVKEKNITVILSLHDIDLAIKGCQTLLLVKNGQIIAQGMPEDIIKTGTINELYDIHGAIYNELLGSVEIESNPKGERIFVVSGAGTGINPYRALSREGYDISSGILWENDIDYQAANSLCSRVISEKPFESISEKSLSSAKAEILNADFILDSGFYIGTQNIQNIQLIKFALENGKRVISLRGREDSVKLFGENKILCCHNIKMLIDKLKTEEN